MKKISGFLFFLVTCFIAFTCGGNAENLKVGDKAPNFTLQDDNGTSYTLSSFRGKSPVVVYFYPKAGTPGCTTEACGIRDDWSKFKENHIEVLGISVDSKEALKKFINKYSLNFPLLSDQDKVVSKEYGVLNKLGIDNRITFIIDKEGYITKIIRNVNVNTHASEVYKIASKLL